MHPALHELLVGLGRLGKRAAAAAVGTALEEAQTVASEVQSRIARGRSQAQEMGRRPPKRVKVDVVGVDPGVEVEEDSTR
jgi:hypothetical protein